MDELVRRLQGEVLTPVPQMYWRDYGNAQRITPRAVVRPESAEDVQTVVAFARAKGLRVVSRGHACTSNGQALSDQIILDTSRLTAFRVISDGLIYVGGGNAWGPLQDRLVSMGLSNRVLTDYAPQTVGGTLSVGGYGQTSTLLGGQVDQVVALDVVTGAGELIHATAEGEHSDLFNYTLCGLGQTGVIVGAELKVRRNRPYSLLNTRRFPDTHTIAQINDLYLSADPPWETGYFMRSLYPAGWELCAGLDTEEPPSHLEEGWTVVENNYRERRKLPDMIAEGFVGAQIKAGLLTHSADACFLLGDWIVPTSEAPGFIEKLGSLFNDPRFSPGVLGLILRNARAAARLPLSPVPDVDTVNVVTPWCIVPPSHLDDYQRRMDEGADACLQAGGRVYLYGQYPKDKDFLRRQFGSATFDAWVAAKDRYDPGKILGPQLF